MASPTKNLLLRRQSDPPSSFHKQTAGAEHSTNVGESVKKIQNELDFAKWYGCTANELLEASYDEYQ
jgi:hypothetical protein